MSHWGNWFELAEFQTKKDLQMIERDLHSKKTSFQSNGNEIAFNADQYSQLVAKVFNSNL